MGLDSWVLGTDWREVRCRLVPMGWRLWGVRSTSWPRVYCWCWFSSVMAGGVSRGSEEEDGDEEKPDATWLRVSGLGLAAFVLYR